LRNGAELEKEAEDLPASQVILRQDSLLMVEDHFLYECPESYILLSVLAKREEGCYLGVQVVVMLISAETGIIDVNLNEFFLHTFTYAFL